MNCRFYHDASCNHFWITNPAEQTCDDFRQASSVESIFYMMNHLGRYKEGDIMMPESQITWISCKDCMPEKDADILFYTNGENRVYAGTTSSVCVGECFHECGIHYLTENDYYAYFPKVR